jgi:hypothetical protein
VPSMHGDCHQAGRALSLALRRIDPTIKPIAFDRRLQRLAQQAHRRPYIFTEQEVRQLLAAARSFSAFRGGNANISDQLVFRDGTWQLKKKLPPGLPERPLYFG